MTPSAIRMPPTPPMAYPPPNVGRRSAVQPSRDARSSSAATEVAAGLTTGPPRSAALASLVLTVPGFWVFALVVHHPKNSSIKLSYVLIALVFAAIYSIGPARGRAIFLGIALIFGLTWMVVQVQNNGAVPFSPSVSSTVESTPLGTGAPGVRSDRHRRALGRRHATRYDLAARPLLG
jgi:hypothetical protein